MKAFHLGMSVPMSHSPHIVQSWVSVLVLIYCERNPLMITEQDTYLWDSRMLLGVILLLCSFSRIIVSSFPLRSMASPVLGSWPSEQCQAWVLFHGMGHRSNQVIAGYSCNICPTIVPEYHPSRSLLQMDQSICSWVGVYIFPLVV